VRNSEKSNLIQILIPVTSIFNFGVDKFS